MGPRLTPEERAKEEAATARKEFLIRLGMEIRERRDRLGISAKQLGERLQPTRDLNYIHRIEVGTKKNILEEEMAQIAAILGTTSEELRRSAGQDVTGMAVSGRGAMPPSGRMLSRVIPMYDLNKMTPASMGPVRGQRAVNQSMSGNAFAVTATDDAVAPTINKHEIAIVDPAIQPRPGDLVVANDPTADRAVIRFFQPLHTSHPSAPGFCLKASDPKLPDIISTQRKPVKVYGTVVSKETLLRR